MTLPTSASTKEKKSISGMRKKGGGFMAMGKKEMAFAWAKKKGRLPFLLCAVGDRVGKRKKKKRKTPDMSRLPGKKSGAKIGILSCP